MSVLPVIVHEKKDKPLLVPCVQLEYDSHKVLVNLNSLKVIKQVSPLTELDLPRVDTSGLSEQQRRIFEVARSLGRFKASDIFAKSGLQFSYVFETLKILEEKGLLLKI